MQSHAQRQRRRGDAAVAVTAVAQGGQGRARVQALSTHFAVAHRNGGWAKQAVVVQCEHARGAPANGWEDSWRDHRKRVVHMHHVGLKDLALLLEAARDQRVPRCRQRALDFAQCTLRPNLIAVAAEEPHGVAANRQHFLFSFDDLVFARGRGGGIEVVDQEGFHGCGHGRPFHLLERRVAQLWLSMATSYSTTETSAMRCWKALCAIMIFKVNICLLFNCHNLNSSTHHS